MAYYWCNLEFSKSNIVRRECIVHGETEKDFIQNMAKQLRYGFGTYCIYGNMIDIYDKTLKAMEREQNLTNHDTYLMQNEQRLCFDDNKYAMKNKQLCFCTNNRLITLDLRNYHDAILAQAIRPVYESVQQTRRSQKQGKRHKKFYYGHWPKGMRNELILESQAAFQTKTAVAFYKWEPKFGKMENNWKQNKKCKHQWESHIRSHADTISTSKYTRGQTA